MSLYYYWLVEYTLFCCFILLCFIEQLLAGDSICHVYTHANCFTVRVCSHVKVTNMGVCVRLCMRRRDMDKLVLFQRYIFTNTAVFTLYDNLQWARREEGFFSDWSCAISSELLGVSVTNQTNTAFAFECYVSISFIVWNSLDQSRIAIQSMLEVYDTQQTQMMSMADWTWCVHCLVALICWFINWLIN